jgi:prevent-host-death family protein
MTTRDHDQAMKPVRIADLKSRLSEYLRAVRRGSSITVLDRDTPIARIVPYEPEANGLIVRRAAGKTPFSKIPLPKPFRSDIDIVELLLQERQGER